MERTERVFELMVGKGITGWAVGTLLLGVFLGAPYAGALSLSLSESTAEPGGSATLLLTLEATPDAPTALVLHLEFDTTQVGICGVDTGESAGDSVVGFRPADDGVVVVIYGGTLPLVEGVLATICFEVMVSAMPESTVTISSLNTSASNGAAEALAVSLPPSVLTIADVFVPHDADTNGNQRMELEELLRVVQHYTLGPFYCDNENADGFSHEGEDRSCPPYDFDFQPQDWQLDLSELLRCIQFYNAPNGAYYRDAAGEDGFSPGQRP